MWIYAMEVYAIRIFQRHMTIVFFQYIPFVVRCFRPSIFPKQEEEGKKSTKEDDDGDEEGT